MQPSVRLPEFRSSNVPACPWISCNERRTNAHRNCGAEDLTTNRPPSSEREGGTLWRTPDSSTTSHIVYPFYPPVSKFIRFD